MAYSNGQISAPVGVYDIQQALGITGGGDVGTLCIANAVNMWSKFKPVISRTSALINTTSQLSGLIWNVNSQSQWWRDTCYKESNVWINCTYGIKVPQAYGLNNLFGRYTGSSGGNYTYMKPTGGNDAPYRQIDFLQYNHNAPSPLGSISAPSSLILTTGDAWSIDVAMMKNQDDDDPVNSRYYVTPEDIMTALWGSCYFGFALIDQADNEAKIWVTGNRYYGISTNGGRLTAGHSYYVMPFYTNTLLPQDESLGNLNPGPASIPGGTQFATIHNINLPQLVIPNGSVTQDDARFSVRGVLQNGRLEVTAIVNATDLVVTGGTIHFFGGKYPEVIIYVCQPGTTVGTGSPNPNDVITSRSFYSVSNYLDVPSGQQKTIGGAKQVFTGINVDKCRIFVYAGNGSLTDPTISARCSGDAMVSSGTPEPTNLI